MNVLKSALKLSKNQANNSQVTQLYEQVKSWDRARARMLQNYLKVVELALDALDGKVGQVENYIQGLDKLMTARIEQITSYCKNGINDSQFFLVPSSLESLKPCHQLLKHLLMEESQRQQSLANKGSVLAVILQKLKKLRNRGDQQDETDFQTEEVTIRQLKSNIRYLIDCELPDINQEVMGSCRAVSQAFDQNKNFYLSVTKFTSIADKQVEKHKDIGKQLLSLVKTFSQREKDIRIRLRQILIQWVNQDLEDKIFGQQLAKTPAEQLINDYYDIQNLISGHSELWKDQSLENYLSNFEILPFRQHERLVVYTRQVFYNGKVQAKVVLTHREAYLFRIGHMEPDFTYILSKNIRIKQKQPLILQIYQVRKTMLLRQEKQFEFTLEFNLETDMKQFRTKSQEYGCQMEK